MIFGGDVLPMQNASMGSAPGSTVLNNLERCGARRKMAMSKLFSVLDVPTRKPRISVVVDEDLLRYLEQWASSEERSISNLVVFLLKQAIEARESE